MDKDSIKSHFDSLFVFASQVPYQSEHLLPVVQACKSLIGINLESVPQNLLKWLESYITNFSPDQELSRAIVEDIQLEVISITRLQELVDTDNLEDGNDYLSCLLQVSDPRHIAEYMLEVAAERSTASCLFCWAAYKSMKIMEPTAGIPILYLCLEALYDMNFENQEEQLTRRYDFELNCHQYQIQKANMVRREKILPKLETLLNSAPSDYKEQFQHWLSTELIASINRDGLLGIHTYLLSLSIEEISPKRLFIMDALRSVIRFADNWKNLPFIQLNRQEAIES